MLLGLAFKAEMAAAKLVMLKLVDATNEDEKRIFASVWAEVGSRRAGAVVRRRRRCLDSRIVKSIRIHTS